VTFEVPVASLCRFISRNSEAVRRMTHGLQLYPQSDQDTDTKMVNMFRKYDKANKFKVLSSDKWSFVSSVPVFSVRINGRSEPLLVCQKN
jgi:hypothetical protein